MTPASLWVALDRRREGWNLASHPFLARWRGGRLEPGELATYASEYDHVVVAIAASASRAAAAVPALDAYAAEEDAHVSLWRAFARSRGWGGGNGWWYAEDPLPQTLSCAQAVEGGRGQGVAERLVALQAIESVQATVAGAQLDALVRHDGGDHASLDYFRVHASLDAERTALLRSVLEPLLAGCDTDELLALVDTVLLSYRQMLDGLQALAVA